MIDDPAEARRAKDDLRRMYDAIGQAMAMRDGEANVAGLSSLSRFQPSERYFYQRKIDAAVSHGGLAPGHRMLEVGSGAGHLTFVFAAMGFDVTAVDLSPRCIAVAKHRQDAVRADHVRFHVADAEDLSQFADGSFDAVVGLSVLRFLPDPAKALREWARVVKAGGRVVVDAPNRWCPWFTTIKPVIGTRRHVHDRLFKPAEMRSLLAQAGLREIRQRTLLFTPKVCPAPVFAALRGLGVTLERLPGINQTAGIIMTSGTR